MRIRPLLGALVLCGCPQPGPGPKPDPTTTDETDTDTDADSDSDTDADSDTDTDADVDWSGEARAVALSGVSGPDGLATFEIEVLPGETALLFTAFAEQSPSVEDLRDPGGALLVQWSDWYDAYSLSDAFFPWYSDVAFNWPIRDIDPALVPGVYQLRIAAGNYVPDVPIEAVVQLKADPDLAAGDVRVRIVYADGVDQDLAVVEAVQAAVVRWKEVWAPYGLNLLETYETSTANPVMGYPEESPDVLGLAQLGDGEQLMLLIGERVFDFYTFGVAGGIPGPLLPSERGAVQLSWLSHAGVDGAFDEDELTLMGETMAHEIGHYMGLFHPVEYGYYWWDALQDTPDCDTWQTCEAVLGENLMYPYSICDQSGCLDTWQLTTQQQGVAHRFTGVLGL